MKCLLSISLVAAMPLLAQDKVDFPKSVAPLLRDNCIKCHGPEKQKGKLRLDSKADAMKGGKNGPVIKPGDSAGSEVYRRITLPKGDDDVMPQDAEPLSQAQIDLLKAWIDQGAAWPDDLVLLAGPAAAAPDKAAKDHAATPSAPDPELPKDFKPGAGEAAAIAAIAKSGVEVRPIAQNTPWHEANFRLQGANVTDATIAPVKDIQSLVELNLANTKVTDSGLSVLENLPYLMTLHLELTGISDDGLSHLHSLSNLVYLNLYGTPVTDAGLEHLKGLNHLKRLYVWQSKVTPDGAKQLKHALPLVDVNTGWDLASLTNAAPKTEEKSEEKK